MKAGKFKKQSSEAYVIAANFAKNMNIPSEDLVENNCTITAEDSEGNDATNEVLDMTKKSIGSGDDQGKLYVQVQAGQPDETYHITFKSGETTAGEEWEKDVYMTIKEL